MFERQTHDSGSFELKGEWWLPDAADIRVPGVVRYDRDSGIEAEFRGSLVRVSYEERRTAVDSIMGLADKGTKCTLLKSRRLGENSLHTEDGRRTTGQYFAPELLVVGWHVPSSAHWRLREVAVNYLHLEKWIGKWAFPPDAMFRLSREETQQKSFISDEVLGPAETFELKNLAAKLSISHDVRHQGDPFLRSELRHIAWIGLESAGRNWFEWFFPTLLHFEGLLSLLIQEPVRAQHVRAFRESAPEESELPASLFYGPSPGRFREELSPNDVAIRLSDVRDIFASVAEQWFAIKDTVEIPLQLYLQSVHHSGTSHVAPLLGLMNAIEFFHRSTVGGEYEKDGEKFKSVLKGIMASLPKELDGDLKRSIHDRLRFANEYTLRRRMKSIQENIPPPMQGGLGIGKKAFWDRVGDTRNFLTHYTTDERSNPYVERHYPVVVYILQRLLSLLLLEAVGIPQKTLDDGLGRSSRAWILDA